MSNPKSILALGLTPALQKIHFFESFVPGEVNRALRVETHAGGKASNLAMALATLGDKAYAGGFNGGATGRLAALAGLSPRLIVEFHISIFNKIHLSHCKRNEPRKYARQNKAQKGDLR